jgi:hypothetical protein
MGADEQQLKQLISKLKAVHVRTFEFDRDGQFSDADVESVRAQLRRRGRASSTRAKRASTARCT